MGFARARPILRALADIDDIVQRVKQSQLYELASLAAVWWG